MPNRIHGEWSEVAAWLDRLILSYALNLSCLVRSLYLNVTSPTSNKNLNKRLINVTFYQ